jgi:hypothetical protein
MSSLLLFIQNISIGIYFIAALGILWGMWSLFSARSELAVAQFRLEREAAQEQGGRAITLVVVLIELIALIWLTTNVTSSAWDEFNNVSATTRESIERFATTVPLAGDSALQVPTALPGGIAIPKTQPPSPTPAGTVRPADQRVGCIMDQANINIPDNGQVVYQVEPIMGTASIQNFSYYRFEIRNVEEDSFRVIGGADSDYFAPVVEGPLGQITPQNFLPGEYRFRLVVFDTSNTVRAACEMTIFISEPLPTATPSQAAPLQGGN